MNKKIETENLILIACDKKILELALAGNQQLSEYIDVTVPDNWTEFGLGAIKYSLEKLKTGESESGWLTYLSIHKADITLIGSCGYKGQPNENKVVEIGYEIKTEYRNRGLATELTKALVINAFNFESVNSIQAHTQAEVNASTKVLTKCGFQKIAEFEDKEDGTLWKWELKR